MVFLQIGTRQKELGHIQIKLLEKSLISLHQAGLPDRRGRLAGLHVIRIGGQIERTHARSDRPGRHHDTRVAPRLETCDGRHQTDQRSAVQRPIFAGQNSRADLDNNQIFHRLHPLGNRNCQQV